MNKLVKRSSSPASMAEALPPQQGCRWGYVGPEPPTFATKMAFDRRWDDIDWRSDCTGDWGFLDIDGSKWAVYVVGDTYAYFECRKGPPKQAYSMPTRDYGWEPPREPSRERPKHPMAHLLGTGTDQIFVPFDELFPTRRAPRRQG
jgi:hypothetical protein